jgi:hypothetical protein
MAKRRRTNNTMAKKRKKKKSKLNNINITSKPCCKKFYMVCAWLFFSEGIWTLLSLFQLTRTIILANIDRSDYSKFKSKYNVAVLMMITGPQAQDWYLFGPVKSNFIS